MSEIPYCKNRLKLEENNGKCCRGFDPFKIDKEKNFSSKIISKLLINSCFLFRYQSSSTALLFRPVSLETGTWYPVYISAVEEGPSRFSIQLESLTKVGFVLT